MNLRKYNEDSDVRLILEVDLHYLKELHDLHNDFPLITEKVLVTREMLSPYCNRIKSKFGLANTQCQKLVPNVME